MYGEVLGTGRDLQVRRVAPLQPADHRLAQQTGQEGVFAVGLLAAPPSGITEDVDVRGPEREPLVLHAAFSRPVRLVVDRAGFSRDDPAHALHALGVERGRKADGLRKDRDLVLRAADSVQAFVPPVVGRNAEPFDGRCEVLHLRRLLFGRKSGDEIPHPFFDRELRIAERKLLGAKQGCGAAHRECEDHFWEKPFHMRIVCFAEKEGTVFGGSFFRFGYLVMTVFVRDSVPSHRISIGSSGSVLSM